MNSNYQIGSTIMTQATMHQSSEELVSVRPQGEEARKHPRHETNGHVVAQVVDAKDEALIGLTFHSDIMEISPCGMRLHSDVLIENGRLDVWAEVKGHPVKMFLTTEVRWSSNNLTGGYQMGVEIVDNPLSDIVEWCEFQRKAWFEHKADQDQS